MGGTVLPEQFAGAPGAVADEQLIGIDERAARRDLREQIARLERELADAFVTAFPLGGLPLAESGAAGSAPGRAAARLLSLGELEQVRDDLAGQLRTARSALHDRAERQEAARLAREHMILAPERHRFMRITCRELGEPGCAWEVRPRLGLIGMLMDWWQVKVSSGCPLSGFIGRSPCARC